VRFKEKAYHKENPMRRLFISILTVLSLAIPAQANDFAVIVGFRSNNADLVNTAANASVKAATSFQAGVLGFFDFSFLTDHGYDSRCCYWEIS
jgi:hypothetical protein